MSGYRIGRRLVYWLFMLFILTVYSTWLIGWPWVCWYHDWQLMRYERSLRNIDLPSGVKLLASEREFGKLWGEGNHCDAQVMLLIETYADDASMSVLADKPVMLRQPFSAGYAKIDVIRVRGRELFQIIQGRTWQIEEGDGFFVRTTSPTNHWWTNMEVRRMHSLVKHAPGRQNTRLYILIARDAIRSLFWLYRSKHLKDYRCH